MTTILPRPVYDALERTVTAFGLGAGRYYASSNSYPLTMVPCCFVGHLEYSFPDGTTHYGLSESLSDRAVYAVNKKKGKPLGSPIVWLDFVGELDIRRESCDEKAHDSSIGCAIRLPAPDLQRMEGQPV